MFVGYSITPTDDSDTLPSGTAPTLPCSYYSELGENCSNGCSGAAVDEEESDLDKAKTEKEKAELVFVAVLVLSGLMVVKKVSLRLYVEPGAKS
ncbi:hypothetical protein L1887_43260 [Cichorium endivia]|nr:hypothetical protein L1887_43260 [Cichorium endivia]